MYSTKFWCVTLSGLLTLVVGCKKPVDPPASPALTLVGNWKITALTFTPAWTPFTNATPVPDYLPYIKVKGETCLSDMTVSFTTAGTYGTNSATTPSCNNGNASESGIILDYLFSEGSTFTETDKQAVLYTKNKVSSVAVEKTGTNETMVLQFQSDEDLSSNKIKTTYAVKMVRQ